MKYLFFGFLFNICCAPAFSNLPSAAWIHARYCRLISHSEINRITYYRAMQGNDKALVNVQLEELKSAPEVLRPAFMGAMLMKRASFFGSAGSRLHYFREGHKMLESAIRQYPENVEFRFLRLMIEEHVPPQLGYSKDIEPDCEFIRKNYKTLPEEVQRTIQDYNKKSKFLKLDVS
jgi:hypothetical protein